MTGVDNLIARAWSTARRWARSAGAPAVTTRTGSRRTPIASSDQLGAGVANWISMWSQSDTQRLRQWYVGDKMYWETPTEYQNWWKQSPIATVKNAKTPIFIHVVDGDPRVPRPQSEEMHMALSKLGRAERSSGWYTGSVARHPRRAQSISQGRRRDGVDGLLRARQRKEVRLA
jgi:hypothetical protein